jgi:hypothetical protein
LKKSNLKRSHYISIADEVNKRPDKPLDALIRSAVQCKTRMETLRSQYNKAM